MLNAMNTGKLNQKQIASYHQDGFINVAALIDREEIDLLSQAAREDRILDQHSFGRDDGTGATVRLSLWNHPGDGIYGMFARCHKLVDSVEQILGEEAYHYHSKMIMKDARVGGAWAYHQHHPSPDPPVQHLRDIIRNAAVFHRRWGWWPMSGWLHEFERRGLIVYEHHTQTWQAVST